MQTWMLMRPVKEIHQPTRNGKMDDSDFKKSQEGVAECRRLERF